MVADSARMTCIDLWSLCHTVRYNQKNAAWYYADYGVWVWNWIKTVNSDPLVDMISVLTKVAIS
jgi:starvation-inducible outer membrane lipoprotein